MKTILIERWMNIYEDGTTFIFNSEKEANNFNIGFTTRIACVKLSGSYQSKY